MGNMESENAENHEMQSVTGEQVQLSSETYDWLFGKRDQEEDVATVDKVTVERIIYGDGIYPGDEDMPVVRIVQYINRGGGYAYGIVYRSEANMPGMLFRYDIPTEYIHDPVVIWRHSDFIVDPTEEKSDGVV